MEYAIPQRINVTAKKDTSERIVPSENVQKIVTTMEYVKTEGVTVHQIFLDWNVNIINVQKIALEMVYVLMESAIVILASEEKIAV